MLVNNAYLKGLWSYQIKMRTVQCSVTAHEHRNQCRWHWGFIQWLYHSDQSDLYACYKSIRKVLIPYALPSQVVHSADFKEINGRPPCRWLQWAVLSYCFFFFFKLLLRYILFCFPLQIVENPSLPRIKFYICFLSWLSCFSVSTW